MLLPDQWLNILNHLAELDCLGGNLSIACVCMFHSTPAQQSILRGVETLTEVVRSFLDIVIQLF